MSKKGFTLLELLVTISIMGILLAVGSVSFTTAQKKGRDARRQTDVTAIQKSLEECFAVDTEYPQAEAVVSGSPLECVGGVVTMSMVPEDPKPGFSYSYSVDDYPATSYCICAQLEIEGVGNAAELRSDGVCPAPAAEDNNYFCVASQQ